MSAHTPGPWAVRLREGRVGERLQLAIVAPRHGELYQLAVLSCVSLDEGDANARLIAAAPELLAALRGIVDAEDAYMRETGIKPDDPITDALGPARAAIAKAEGR